MTESQRITEEAEQAERRAGEQLPRVDESKEASGGILSPTPEDAAERQRQENVVALCEAEQKHYAYSTCGAAIKAASLALEVVIIRYETMYGDESRLWRPTSPEYKYAKALLSPCIAALKNAAAINADAGEATADALRKAQELCNPQDKKAAAELGKQAASAVEFANKYLDWVSQFERKESA